VPLCENPTGELDCPNHGPAARAAMLAEMEAVRKLVMAQPYETLSEAVARRLREVAREAVD
jgi:uncharacterized Zn finger protein (UPF0148 family)